MTFYELRGEGLEAPRNFLSLPPTESVEMFLWARKLKKNEGLEENYIT